MDLCMPNLPAVICGNNTSSLITHKHKDVSHEKWEFGIFNLIDIGSFHSCSLSNAELGQNHFKQLLQLSNVLSYPLPSLNNPHPPNLTWSHCRIFSRVSGNLRATRPPHISAVKDSRMGTALVLLTKLVKIELPSTAANLHRAFSTPKAVALKYIETWE